ncbi:hypothetical protein K2173_014309 [Erythroxylum novogranatense]|uniref:Uncharacterized protein n=1 Tax=Erythroxylum novogranatense TaxID=1862640 RepID=A0AAV8SEG1_9ROSI|nr:hypothetical protein K2173_014309 [Erythroxylum novogranatense]
MFNTNDSLLWHHERNEIYTVKSGYRISRYEHGTRIGANDVLWKRVWELQVPPKLRDFMWRALREVLPTKVCLQSKGIDVDGLCPLCFSMETVDHTFLHCAKVVKCWHLVAIVNLTANDSLDGKFRRCGMIRNNYGRQPADVTQMDESQQSFLLNVGWSLFTDAALFHNEGATGFGCIAESAEGGWIGVVSGFQEGVFDPAVAEAIACRYAINYATHFLEGTGVVYTDSQVLVQALSSSKVDFSAYGLIIQNCKLLLDARPNIEVKWITRHLNRAAHSLARGSIRFSRYVIWETIPDVISSFYRY